MTHPWAYLFLGLLICLMAPTLYGMKMILATDDECGRYSLDALYHERFAPDTEAILDDCRQFATEVTNLILQSLQEISVKLPGKSSSSERDRLMYKKFTYPKDEFIRKVNKVGTNITNSWDRLVKKNHEFMAAKPTSSIADVTLAARELFDAYNNSRKAFDDSFELLIWEIKNLVRNGIKAIEIKVDNDIEVETMREERMAREKKNSTSDDEEDDFDNEDDFDDEEDDEATVETEETGLNDQTTKNKETEDQTKKHEHDHDHHHHHHHHDESETNPYRGLPRDERIKTVIQEIVPLFLGNVSTVVLDKKIDLFKEVKLDINSRDLPLDDMLYEITLMKSRVISTTTIEDEKDEDLVSLARRNLYMYFSQLVSEFYRKKIKNKKNILKIDKKATSLNETQIAERLVDLMQSYNLESVAL